MAGLHFLGVATNAAGTPISGATISVTLAGTTTATNIFTDAALSVAAANPLTVNADGTWEVFIAGGQTIRVRELAAGATTRDGDNLAGPGGLGVPGVTNLSAVASTTTVRLTADAAALRDAHQNTVVRAGFGTLTNVINDNQTGSEAGKRDTAGATAAAAGFNNAWLHVYLIWNNSSLNTVSSLVAPLTGPTLPAGYTHWAYAGAWRAGAPNFVRAFQRGRWIAYEVMVAVLTTGQATTETAIDLSTAIPPNALRYSTRCQFAVSTGAAATGFAGFSLNLTSGVTSNVQAQAWKNAATDEVQNDVYPTLPNLGQTVYYNITDVNARAA